MREQEGQRERERVIERETRDDDDDIDNDSKCAYPPHVYAIADRAYDALMHDRTPQVIIRIIAIVAMIKL